MRVIAGKYKKTPLYSLEGIEITRPTKDMVKEALFSSININNETFFLDLFSGSGAIGIEALSRGAREVVFNDINAKACEVINKNLKKINENRLVLNLDFKKCLDSLNNKFNYIYCDPPYNFDNYEDLIEGTNRVLNDDGTIIVEIKKTTDLNDEYRNLIKYKEKKYGISKLVYYRRREND